MLIYVIGPVTGRPDLNRPAFEAARRLLERRGYAVEVPHDTPRDGLGARHGHERGAAAVRRRRGQAQRVEGVARGPGRGAARAKARQAVQVRGEVAVTARARRCPDAL